MQSHSKRDNYESALLLLNSDTNALERVWNLPSVMAKAALPAAHSSSDSAANANIFTEREKSPQMIWEKARPHPVLCGSSYRTLLRFVTNIENATHFLDATRKQHALAVSRFVTLVYCRPHVPYEMIKLPIPLAGVRLTTTAPPTRVTWVFFSSPRHGSMNGDLIWCRQGHFRHFTQAFVEVDFPKKGISWSSWKWGMVDYVNGLSIN